MYQHLLVSLVIAAAPAISQGTAKPGAPPPPPPKPAATTTKPADAAQKPAAAAAGKGVRTVEIVGTEDMKYSVTNITAKPGEQLRVRLVVKGAMPKVAMAHNFVLLKKGVAQTDFINAAVLASATAYIPADKKADVIANTAMAGAGETVEVTFKVPAAPGDYPYICTFPGHAQAGMRGTLTVK
jgi:azurin